MGVFILLYVCPHTAICVLILLYMCPHTAMCVLILLYICPHTVSSYCYMCVLILLYVCPDTTICVSWYCYVCPHTTTCVLTLRYMCPHTTIYVSSYYYICVLNTTIYVPSHYYICVLVILKLGTETDPQFATVTIVGINDTPEPRCIRNMHVCFLQHVKSYDLMKLHGTPVHTHSHTNALHEEELHLCTHAHTQNTQCMRKRWRFLSSAGDHWSCVWRCDGAALRAPHSQAHPLSASG